MLKVIRNDAVCKIVNPPAEHDLGIDDGVRRKKVRKVALAVVPEVISITLPAVAGHGAMSVKALPGSGIEPAWLELSAACITYLTYALASQDCCTKEHREREEPNERHIIFDDDRQAFRVRFGGASKWFPKARHIDALSDARAYLDGLVPNGVAEGGGGQVEADASPAGESGGQA